MKRLKGDWSPIAESQVWVGLGVEDLQARDGRLRFKMELAFLIDFGICWLILSSNLWDVRNNKNGFQKC